MANTITRRPLPALISLIALLALTGLVWWRVIARDDDSGAKTSPKASGTSCSTAPVATPTATLAAPGSVTVQVLNSTSRSGIAAKARTALLAAGFKSPAPAGNDGPSVSITATAQIRYGAAGAGGAQLLRFYFPGAKLTLVKTTRSAIVTVSLGNGYTKVASTRQVRAAEAASRTATGPTTTGTGQPATASASAAGASC